MRYKLSIVNLIIYHKKGILSIKKNFNWLIFFIKMLGIIFFDLNKLY